MSTDMQDRVTLVTDDAAGTIYAIGSESEARDTIALLESTGGEAHWIRVSPAHWQKLRADFIADPAFALVEML